MVGVAVSQSESPKSNRWPIEEILLSANRWLARMTVSEEADGRNLGEISVSERRIQETPPGGVTNGS